MAATVPDAAPAGERRSTGIHGAPPRPGLRTPDLPGVRVAGAAAQLARSALLGSARRLTQPWRPADLDERDPDALRGAQPLMWLISSLWFRAEVRGLGNVPAEGPVLLLGNHSGGHTTPDSLVFALAFSTYFGVERRLHLLTSSHVFSLPGLGSARKAGVVTATAANAREALEAGGVACLYPGGSHEAHRPSWQSGTVELGDLGEPIELARRLDAPIVPLVSIGGQETALFLASGEGLAAALRLNRIGIERVPVSLALPWGVSLGDLLGHLPLPAKLVTEVLPPIDVRRRLETMTGDEVADHLRTRMQETLDALVEERRLPLVG